MVGGAATAFRSADRHSSNWANWAEVNVSCFALDKITPFMQAEDFVSNKSLIEGGVRGVRKPQNRTEIRQKTANRIGFFPEYRNRAYM